MGQFINTNGDYNIKTAEGSQIKLDTGPGVGTVRITGNLLVEGETLTVSAANLNVEDNIIIVNFGETGAGVTLNYAGLEVSRGTEPAASLVYDESADTWMIAHGSSPGPFNYDTGGRLRLKEILTNSTTDTGDLTLIGNSSPLGLVKVSSTNYAQEVIERDDDNVIPNKKYVDDAIQNNPTYQIVQGNTRVVSFDKDDLLDPGLNFPPSVGPYTSQPEDELGPISLIGVVVDNTVVTSFYKDHIEMGGLTIFRENPTPDNLLVADSIVIQATDSTANIKLQTNSTGKVQITYAVQLDYVTTADPVEVADTTLLYAKPPGAANTGLYFVRPGASEGEELIGKQKALLYSMIF